MTAHSDFGTMHRLLAQARPFWGRLGLILFVDLLATPLALLVPLPVKIAVDSVLGSEPLPAFLERVLPISVTGSTGGLLVVSTAMIGLIALSQKVQAIGSELLKVSTGQRLIVDFRARLVRHALHLSIAHHDNEGTSDAVYRIQYDTPSIQSATVHGIVPFATATTTLIGMIWVTAVLDAELALIALAVTPVLFVLTWAYRKPVKRRWEEVKRIDSDAYGLAQESFSAIRVVKAFGREDHEKSRFVRRSLDKVGSYVRLIWFRGGFDTLMGLTIAGGSAAVLFFGVRHVQEGVLTLGGLLMIMAYLNQLYQPLQAIGGQVTNIQESLAMADRAFALLDQPLGVEDRSGARSVDRANGAVAFRSVWFGYDPNQPILKNVSFDIPAGTRVAVAGRTGAGKTTLINLLMRFYDPSEGAVFLDGVDLRAIRLEDLRNQFALVLQDPFLFSGSIRENIAYGRPGASEAEIVEAARAASADSFIKKLPDGYETAVGERGMKLSGGERQRISLARAFLKDAPLLVLDEPTSSVDVGTEATIIKALERLMVGRTTFLIAHRASTLAHCDLLLLVDDGRVSVVKDEFLSAALPLVGDTVKEGGATEIETPSPLGTGGRIE